MAKKAKINVSRNLLKQINFKKEQLKSQKKAVQAECTHSGKKIHLKRMNDAGMFKCTECRAKINFGKLLDIVNNNTDDKRKAMKKHVKKSFRDVNDLLQTAKLNISNKDKEGVDKRIYEKIVKQLKGNFMLEKLVVAIVGDNLKCYGHKKNNNGGKKRKTVSLGYGTKGMF